MARYTDESRERVRDAADFAEIVGARTELKRAGVSRLQGLCPFHEERTPSFGIDPVEKVYYCFGCGAGGDVFKFVMETEGLDFAAALESLAERYRVPLERETEDPGEAAKRERRERLFALLERTAAYYVRVLWESPDAAGAREYLQQRGLTEDALRMYRVGYAPDAWDRVLTGSQRAGYSVEELHAAGLIQPSRGGAGLIDRFRGRITFPLADERGRVLGFGARAMTPEQRPKYLNTSDGEVFHKGRIVYGADLARAAAARAGRVVLVEGYTDVIALHQAGVPEVVAQMGTALTDPQINAVAKLAPKALFCQDPDRAGQESVARGIAALRSVNAERRTRGVEFRIVRLPAGQDPADVVQRSGAEAMRELLEQAVPLERFEVERALEQPDASTDELLAAAAQTIGPMPTSVLRAELVKLVSDRLGLGERLVSDALRAPAAPRAWNGHRGGGAARPEPIDPQRALARREQSERAFLAYCVALPDEGERRLATVDVEEYFSTPATRQAATYLRGRLRTPTADLPPGDEALARLVAEVVVSSGGLEATNAKLELEALQLDLHRIERQIAVARQTGDTSGVGALANERQRVHEEIRHRLT
ncbi:MAG TPA: DNA primase [Solirubrobacter sp.]|nr:DNA primase [Solirubrobacter sp.]